MSFDDVRLTKLEDRVTKLEFQKVETIKALQEVKMLVENVIKTEKETFFDDKIQKKILKVLLEDGSYLTTSEVADKAGISWNTAMKYLKGWKWRVLSE